MGGGRVAADRRSETSVPLTLMGNLPLMTRLSGRGVSAPSLDSSPPDSVSERSDISFCFKNFLICAVTATSFNSLSFRKPPFGGLLACGCKISLGGNRIGLPSNFKTWSDVMSARHKGKSSMRFFWTDRTFSDVSLDSSCGNTRSLFRPRSNISSDERSHIYP